MEGKTPHQQPQDVDIEKQYIAFLSGIGLSEETMHPVQKKQLRMAFYGGFATLLWMMREVIAVKSEEDGILDMKSLEQQTVAYWASTLSEKSKIIMP
jgi:hypothetical protein